MMVQIAFGVRTADAQTRDAHAGPLGANHHGSLKGVTGDDLRVARSAADWPKFVGLGSVRSAVDFQPRGLRCGGTTC